MIITKETNMNILHVVAVGKDLFYNMELIFNDEGQIQSELIYKTSTIEAVPHNIVLGNMLDAWKDSDKSLQTAKEFFYHSVVIDGKRVFLKPIQLNRIADHKIIGGDYSIFTSDLGVVVNYKPGKFEDFKMLHQAIHWITEIHHPAQQVKKLSKLVSSIAD